MGIPHKCPVCEGRINLPPDFYGGRSTNAAMEVCRACGGTGIVWEVTPKPSDYPNYEVPKTTVGEA